MTKTLPVPYSNLEMLIPAVDITARVHTLANEIAQKLPHDIMIIALLRGSFVFASDLIRALHGLNTSKTVGPQIDFMTLSSYGGETVSSGSIQIVRDLAESVAERDVLIVDDILESGRTLAYAKELISSRNAKSVQVAVLLEKPGKRKVDVNADFIGFIIPDKFVVGYGLDYANFYRELPYIGVIKTE